VPESANEFSVSAFSSWPIPPLRSPAGWQEVRIRECGERLVPLSALDPRRIVVDPRYHQAGYAGAPREAYVRESVARLLHTATATLPAGWTLAILDAWRPVAVQQA
jgi:D-alanyl-D-alanine dipeptidase